MKTKITILVASVLCFSFILSSCKNVELTEEVNSNRNNLSYETFVSDDDCIDNSDDIIEDFNDIDKYDSEEEELLKSEKSAEDNNISIEVNVDAFEKAENSSQISDVSNNSIDIDITDSSNIQIENLGEKNEDNELPKDKHGEGDFINNSENNELITAEQLLSFANLTSADVYYLDVEELIAIYSMTSKVIELNSSQEVRDFLLNKNYEEEHRYDWLKNSYLHMVQTEFIEQPEGFSYKNCERICVYYMHENSAKVFVLDKSDGKAYYGRNIIENKNNAEITVDLTYDILADVIIRIEDAKLEELDYSYISQEDIGARNSWGIAFECEEGIVRYYVYNATGEEPSRIINCVHDLLEYAKGLAE